MSSTSKPFVRGGQVVLGGLAMTIISFVLAALLSGMSLYAVYSGSMEPDIPLGSIVVVRRKELYESGDVITFVTDHQLDTTVTHRIVSRSQNGVVYYITQGDANDSPDSAVVFPSDIRGAVVWDVPYIGYIAAWLYTGGGYVYLVLLPAGLIVGYEIYSILNEIERKRSSKQIKDEQN